jgi:TetR/AcrR family transcriptional regulator, transcriptional repressor for nem operon
MARTKEFDEGEVVERAMRVFWNLGYDGASMPDILLATGLSRSSLYETFADKRTLFLKTVSVYVRTASERRRALLSAGADFKKGMKAYLGSRLDGNAERGVPGGCYLTSISASLKTADDELRAIVQEAAHEAEREIRDAFDSALAAGQVSARLDAAAWTSFFLAFSWGLNVAARMGRPRSEQADMVAAFLSFLDES